MPKVGTFTFPLIIIQASKRFYNLVLLPRVRDDIDEFKKLHFHMYQCLFKAMYKPAAFFKGILLPLCRVFQYQLSFFAKSLNFQSNTCTLREAVVFGSMLRKGELKNEKKM